MTFEITDSRDIGTCLQNDVSSSFKKLEIRSQFSYYLEKNPCVEHYKTILNGGQFTLKPTITVNNPLQKQRTRVKGGPSHTAMLPT